MIYMTVYMCEYKFAHWDTTKSNILDLIRISVDPESIHDEVGLKKATNQSGRNTKQIIQIHIVYALPNTTDNPGQLKVPKCIAQYTTQLSKPWNVGSPNNHPHLQGTFHVQRIPSRRYPLRPFMYPSCLNNRDADSKSHPLVFLETNGGVVKKSSSSSKSCHTQGILNNHIFSHASSTPRPAEIWGEVFLGSTILPQLLAQELREVVVIIHSRFKSIKLEKLATHFIKNIFNKTGNKTYGNENRFSIASAHSTSKTYFRPSTSAKIKISIIINDTCFHFSAIWNFMTMTISMKTCLKWHVSCLK